jgi:hypothetical protein
MSALTPTAVMAPDGPSRDATVRATIPVPQARSRFRFPKLGFGHRNGRHAAKMVTKANLVALPIDGDECTGLVAADGDTGAFVPR